MLGRVAPALLLTGIVLTAAPPAASGQTVAACDDGIDNDADGRVDAAEDPGCLGDPARADETDPAPVPSTVQVKRARPYGCGLQTPVEVLPALEPEPLFLFGDLRLTLSGRGIERARTLPVEAIPAHLFTRLRAGRFRVTAQYLGDPFRLPSAVAAGTARLTKKRCRVYFAGTATRRVRPRAVAIGASQQIYGIRWRSWGGRTARGTGTFPVNDCIPYCAGGTITPRRVAVRLSRRAVCRGYEEYLRLRYRPLSGGSPRPATVGFAYRC
jgi:hypothetical protein